MKKIYLLFCLLAAGYAGNAQTFPNAGMETWHSGTSGSSAAVTIHAPDQWYGSDSLVIAFGETPPFSFLFSGPLYAQIFQENTIVHGGSSSAKLITLRQDTLGYFPAILSNAQPQINTAVLESIFLGGSGSVTDAVSYKGGTAIGQRISSVSAWLQYKAGVDSTGAAGVDSGLMTVQAIAFIGGRDSVVGSGTVLIPPTGGMFVQMTDSIVYNDMVNMPDTIRVTFGSGFGTANPLDSSTLYVDDVTMRAATEAVPTIANSHVVNVYPNPASTVLHIDGPQNAGYSCQVYSLTGQVVITQTLTGNDVLNISELAAGNYTYAIADKNGNTVQNGEVTVAK